MKDTQDINVVVCDNVSNPVMAIEENANISFRFVAVLVAEFWKINQDLCFIINAGNDFPGSGGIILCYIFVDFF